MQVTFNPVNYQNQYKQNNTNAQFKRQNTPQYFKGNPVQGAEEVISTVTGKSRLFDPLKKIGDQAIEIGAKYIISPFLDFKPIRWFADKTKNVSGMVNHLNVAGSAAISGMYIKKTLDNDKLDKDRKYTLAFNQGLVFLASTAGCYLLDGSLAGWWNDTVTPKYAGIFLGEQEKMAEFVKQNKAIKEANKNLAKEAKKPLLKMADYIKKEINPDNLKLEKLNKRLDGMDVAKKLFIFATVYRYLSPIIVTPIANRLGEKYIAYKKEKEQELQKQQNSQKPQNIQLPEQAKWWYTV